MFTVVIKYHTIMGNLWCFLAENTLNVFRRERYILNAKKHLDYLIGVKTGLEDIMSKK